MDPPDYRGEESFRIEFSLAAETHMPQEGFVHRTWDDFVKFDHLLTTHLLNFGLDFPSEPSVEALDEYLQRVMSHSMIVSSNMLSDLLGINWSGSDLKFLTSLPSFMQVVFPFSFTYSQLILTASLLSLWRPPFPNYDLLHAGGNSPSLPRP